MISTSSQYADDDALREAFQSRQGDEQMDPITMNRLGQTRQQDYLDSAANDYQQHDSEPGMLRRLISRVSQTITQPNHTAECDPAISRNGQRQSYELS